MTTPLLKHLRAIDEDTAFNDGVAKGRKQAFMEAAKMVQRFQVSGPPRDMEDYDKGCNDTATQIYTCLEAKAAEQDDGRSN